MKIRYTLYALTPLAVLLIAAGIASVLGYFVVLAIGDQFPLRKVISRTTQILLILSILPWMSWLKLGLRDIGFAPAIVFFRQLLVGLGIAVLTLMPVLVMLWLLDIEIFDQGRIWTVAGGIKALSGALLSALIISLLEEPLFRGMLLTGLARKMGLWAAIFLSAFYYAALHFLKGKSDIPYDEMTVFSGFGLVREAFASLANPEIVSAFVALFMVGVFLGVMRSEIKYSLGLCIGCHAGWVWQIKMTKKLFNSNPEADWYWLISNYDGVIGPLVSGWLLLVIVVYLVIRRGSQR